MFAPKVLTSEAEAARDPSANHHMRSEIGRGSRHPAADNTDLETVAAHSWDFAAIPLNSGIRSDQDDRLLSLTHLLGEALQAKLAIGAMNDPLEDEAERAAEQVLASPEPNVPVTAAPPHLSRLASSSSTSTGTEMVAQAGQAPAPSVGEMGDAHRDRADLATAAVTELGEPPMAPVLSAVPLRLQGQWSDAPLGPLGGARSDISQAPSFGWNRDEVIVGTIRRIPLEGLALGNQRSDPKRSDRDRPAEEDTPGRAIALIPEGIDLTKPVEVLLHLHGFNVGYRQRRTQGQDPSLKPGTVRDVETDRIEQQLQASGRPMIAVLPQGTITSGFGKLNADAYIAEVFRKLSSTGAFGSLPAPKVARVVLSGHSGGGGPIAEMVSEPGQPRLPSSLGEVALFDAINGEGQLNLIRTWVLSQLDRDLSALAAPGISQADQEAYLRTSLRFRAYYTNRSYIHVHTKLAAAIESWFTRNAAQLGGSSSTLYEALRKRYQVIPVGHPEHDVIMSRGDRLLDALRTLPTSAAAAGPSATGPPEGEAMAPGPVQRRSDRSRPIDSTSLARVDTVLGSSGAPLDVATRTFFQRRFGHDFSKVRVHTSEQAAASARGIQAEAYTVGRDIVFNSGSYEPASMQGKRLLAHELAHVVHQTGPPLLTDNSVQRQPMRENLTPVRSDEAAKSLPIYTFGQFSIFVPERVILGSRKEITNVKVHVFFAAGGVAGADTNDILVHGLRGASDQSEWITIGVPGITDSANSISDAEISSCLRSIGIDSSPVAVRLTGHSRGCDSLLHTVLQGLIKAPIDRIVLLDEAIERFADGSIRLNRVQKLVQEGHISPGIITSYESAHKTPTAVRTSPALLGPIPADPSNPREKPRYIELDPSCMAAIGAARLVQDGMALTPEIAQKVNANPKMISQLNNLHLPPRGSFTTGPSSGTRVNINDFCHEPANTNTGSRSAPPRIKKSIEAIIRDPVLIRFIDANKEKFIKYSTVPAWASLASHEFFVAEIAHELTE